MYISPGVFFCPCLSILITTLDGGVYCICIYVYVAHVAGRFSTHACVLYLRMVNFYQSLVSLRKLDEI